MIEIILFGLVLSVFVFGAFVLWGVALQWKAKVKQFDRFLDTCDEKIARIIIQKLDDIQLESKIEREID